MKRIFKTQIICSAFGFNYGTINDAYYKKFKSPIRHAELILTCPETCKTSNVNYLANNFEIPIVHLKCTNKLNGK